MPQPQVRPDVRAFLDMLAANARPALTADRIAQSRDVPAAGVARLALRDRPASRPVVF